MRSTTIKIYALAILALLSSPAYALPIPEMASAVFGIGEVLLFLVAALGIYFPFFRKSKKNKTSKTNRASIYLYVLLVVSLILNAYYFSTTTYNDFKNASTSLANEERPGMRWTQADRDNDPNAIPEAEAYKILLEEEKQGFTEYVFIDARSRAETELGTAPGFVKIRWADLLERSEELKGRTVIATCWTGMRGSEVCDKLRAKGIKCKYLKEGLAGWIKQGYPVNLSQNTTLADFGTSEAFENSYKILSVREAVSAAQTGAHVIDVREPDKFNKSSIPNSINMPYDELTTAMLEYKIDSLPPQKVLVACYGIMSCSEASALGWELHRMGYPYLGAYSGGVDKFVEVYNNDKVKSQNSWYKTLEGKTVQILKNLSHVYPIEILIVLSSLVLGIVLFITKNMSLQYFRDFKARQNKKRDLLQSYNGDEWLVNRENQKNYKSQLSHIGSNIVITLLALFYAFMLAVIFEALGEQRFLGITNWQDKSGISVLSIAGAFMLTLALLYLLFKKSLNNPKSLYLLSLVLFSVSFIAVAQFSKIGVLYFISTVGVMYLIQGTQYIFGYLKQKTHEKQFKSGYIDLALAYDYIPRNTKASRLAELLNLNYRVPKGYVIVGSQINNLPKSLYSKIKNKLDKSNSGFAVRSSAIGEDSIASSQAGLNLSVVPAHLDNLAYELTAVYKSYNSTNPLEVVLVQELVNPMFSGVAFSHNPAWGGTILIEYGTGLSGKRMEGVESVEQIVIERATGTVVYQTNQIPEHSVMLQYIPEIYKTILELEQFYGYAVDIEWAIDNVEKVEKRDNRKTKSNSSSEPHELWLLQARPQSGLENLNYSVLDLDKKEVLKSNLTTLSTNELSLSMPAPSRLSAELICELWATGNSADKASRMAMWTWNKTIKETSPYIYLFNKIWASAGTVLTKPNKLNWYSAKRGLSDNIIEIESEIQKLLNQHKIQLAVNWGDLDNEAWVKLYRQTLSSWQQAQEYAFYFEFMAQSAIEELEANLIKTNQSDKLSTYISVKPNFSVDDIMYRSDNDYELSEPRYTEYLQKQDSVLLDKIQALFGHNVENKELGDGLDSTNQKQIVLARQMIQYREEYKHYCIVLFYHIRRAILDLQARTQLGAEIFELNPSEVEQLFTQNSQNSSDLKQILLKRLELKQQIQSVILPDTLNPSGIALFQTEYESRGLVGQLSTQTKTNSNLSKATDNNLEVSPGVFVSKPSDIKGRLLIIEDNIPLVDIEQLLINFSALGEAIIIYSKFVSPHLVHLAVKYKVAGLCALYGSMLSHPAVLAREANIPFLIKIDVPFLIKNMETIQNKSGNSVSIFTHINERGELKLILKV